ncbi:helix-turn-helix domain-containing protein [Dietzia sp. WMMA184]|uniref:helix-turn-helix domain-containing protein n=1 Tax=Dietzia sp. WMMA184 TaxID=2039808 RepID=UPI000BDEEBB1|nr:helix-turn-helix transcriptional regulator [Dietzia sp. WMMA184]
MPRLNPDLAEKVDAVETDLRKILGTGARRIRQDASANLEQVSQAARRAGLPWSTGRVSDLEGGRVEVKLETLLSLALALGEVRGEPVTLAELLPNPGPVLVNGREIASLTGAVGGEAVTVSEGQREHDQLNRPDPVDSAGLAEKRAAKSMGVPLVDLVTATHELWDHHLTEERDRRAGADADVATRGRITRELTDQIRKHLGI